MRKKKLAKELIRTLSELMPGFSPPRRKRHESIQSHDSHLDAYEYSQYFSGYVSQIKPRDNPRRRSKQIQTYNVTSFSPQYGVLYRRQNSQGSIIYSQRIGLLIKSYRKKLSMTQEELARVLNIDPTTISRHENGTGLTIEIILEYSKAFDVDIQTLIPPTKMHSNEDTEIKLGKILCGFQRRNGLSDEQLIKVLELAEKMIQV